MWSCPAKCSFASPARALTGERRGFGRVTDRVHQGPRRELDRHETDAKVLGSEDSLLHAAMLEGFDDWPDVVRLAREGHPVAVELLCRRVEREP